MSRSMAALAGNSEAVSELLAWGLAGSQTGPVEAASESGTSCSYTGLQVEFQVLRSILEQRDPATRRLLAVLQSIDVQGLRPCDMPAFGSARDGARVRRLRTALLQGDEKEHRGTWEYLRRALDEDRLSDRKLFP